MGPATMEDRHGLAAAGARMLVVFALLAVEVGAAVVVAAAVLGAETLVRGRRLDQRSVHRKMLVRPDETDQGRHDAQTVKPRSRMSWPLPSWLLLSRPSRALRWRGSPKA